MITHAAIKFRGEIYKGKWHIEPLTELKIKFSYFNDEKCDAQTKQEIEMAEQGFLTDAGDFLGRKEALEHVFECGQPYYPEGFEWDQLYSEHIFPPKPVRRLTKSKDERRT